MAKRIIVAVIFVPLLFAVILLLPPLVWTAVVAGISAMAAFELLRATVGSAVPAVMRGAAIVSAALIPLSRWYGLEGGMELCAFAVMVISFGCAIRAYSGQDAPIGLFQVLITLFGGAVMPLFLSALVALMRLEQGRYLVLLAVLLAFVTDAGAYFAGVFLGKHRGITKVSPNKSAEGYVGGFAAGAAFAVIYGMVVSAATGAAANLFSLALCGLLGALVTEIGDLAFSFIKREYGVKDFGHLLPGHGGILDRFDSMIFCGPMVLLIVRYLPAF